ncbi:GntR family transcriptional regulator [Agrobacterium sp. ICMP 6402]|uniref:GntR family transcriptional regulator n=1 Tax=Agrobacterium sp. ICMP 6402 TaxID=2292443 RepID=UPI001FEFA620|nr:GntR family transcriptional regulator [Agrobacterium sp. ICMP 6402]
MTNEKETKEEPFATVVRALEEDIVLGRLHPRERLIEEELAERFAVSRHALRLAIVELDRMGLVERFPNKGAMIRAFSASDVEQLYSLREILETTAASQILFPVEEPDIDDLKEIQAHHDKAVETDDLVGVFRRNHEFHRKLFSLCRNHYLASAIETYSQRAHGIRFMVLADKVERSKARDQHHQMIRALECQDGEALVELCKNHLPASKLAYLRTYGKIVN